MKPGHGREKMQKYSPGSISHGKPTSSKTDKPLCNINDLDCASSSGLDKENKFTLSVRVLAASLPTLTPSSMLVIQQLFAEVSWGEESRETKFAVHSGERDVVDRTSCSGPCIREDPASDKVYTWPWRFNDTVTFSGSLDDMLGSGLQVRLKVLSEIEFGFTRLQVAQLEEVGNFSLDLRQTVLPACRHVKPDFVAGFPRSEVVVRSWASPTVVIPLATDDAGVLRLAADEKAAGHIALSFSTNVDPTVLERHVANADWCAAGKRISECRCCKPRPPLKAMFVEPSAEPQSVASRTLAREENAEVLSEAYVEAASAVCKRIPPSYSGSQAACMDFSCGHVAIADSPQGNVLLGNSARIDKSSESTARNVQPRSTLNSSKPLSVNKPPFRTI